MYIEKVYFEWDRKLDFGRFQLDMKIPDDILLTEFEILERSTYKSKLYSFLQIVLDEENRISSKLIMKGGKIGQLDISWRFQPEVIQEVSHEFKQCDKSYSGDKLALYFGDSYLHGARVDRYSMRE